MDGLDSRGASFPNHPAILGVAFLGLSEARPQSLANPTRPNQPENLRGWADIPDWVALFLSNYDVRRIVHAGRLDARRD